MTLRLLMALALFAFCCSANQTHAQMGGGMGGMGVEPTFDLEFPGGTVQDLYELFKAAGREKQTIISEEAKSLKVPSLSVSNIPISSFYQLVSEFAEENDRILFSDAGAYATLRLRPKSKPQPKPVALGTVSLSTLLPKDSPQEKIDEQIEPILRALKTAMEFIKSNSSSSQVEMPAFRYHPETGLLFVIGTEHELKIANVVLEKATSPHYRLEIVSLSEEDSPAKDNDKE